MANTGISGGDSGYVGIATESIPGGIGARGTFVSPTDFPPVEAKKPTRKPDKTAIKAYTGSRDTTAIQRNTKYKRAMTFNLALLGNTGALLHPAALGGCVWIPAVASDTIASVTTVNGISTLVLTGGTGGAGAYTQNAWISLDPGPLWEARQILSWTPGTKTMTVAALKFAHGALPSIVQPGQNKISPLSAASGYSNALRSVSIENNVGGLYSQQYPDGLIAKQTFKASKDKIDVAYDFNFSAPPTRPAIPTAYVRPADLDFRTPYSYNDGFIVVNADTQATGVSTFQQVLLSTDWTVTLMNKLDEHALNDNTDTYRYWPVGERTVTVDYSLLQAANRPAGYEDTLIKNVESPFMASYAQNVGTAAAPVLQAFGLVIPNVHWEDAEEMDTLDISIAEKLPGTARPNGSQDILDYFIVNNATAAF